MYTISINVIWHKPVELLLIAHLIDQPLLFHIIMYFQVDCTVNSRTSVKILWDVLPPPPSPDSSIALANITGQKFKKKKEMKKNQRVWKNPKKHSACPALLPHINCILNKTSNSSPKWLIPPENWIGAGGGGEHGKRSREFLTIYCLLTK